MENAPLESDERAVQRKRIALIKRQMDPQQIALNALADDKNGAEWGILAELAASLLSGRTIDPIFQSVVNGIVAQAMIFEKLPLKPRGRPKDQEGIDGWSIAYRYFALKDRGASYENAVAQVAAEFFKDERHIMRLVKKNKSWIGNSIEEREHKRKWWEMCADMERKIIAEGAQPTSVRMKLFWEEEIAKDQERDFIEELDQLIDSALSQRNPTDIK